MKWIYSFRHKITAALLLTTVLCLVLWNNWQTRSDMQQLGTYFSEIYEDRLLVESYIYELSENLHEEQELIEKASVAKSPVHYAQRQQQLELERSALLVQYEQTHLTTAEARLFGEFKALLTHRASISRLMSKNAPLDLKAFKEDQLSAFALLHALSKIQVQEGTRLKTASGKILLGNAAAAEFEVALLILIALVINALLLASKSTASPVKQQFNLN